jgi:polysaccharide transporter, PST family
LARLAFFSIMQPSESVSRRLLLNALSLYLVQGCTYLLPLITFPYLARVLGPKGWGTVLFSQAIGAAIAAVVEYGFEFSATREVARFSHQKQRLQELVAGVLGAKAVLATLGLIVVILARPYTFRVAASPALFWASLFWGVAQGINMLWYFQGLQRMAWAGGLDIAGKVVATVCIFAFVRQPEDGWKMMMAQALGCGVSHAITVGIASYEVGFCWPRPRLVMEALRLSWSMFLFRASMGLFSSANGLVLGFLASPIAVGWYGAADKFRQIALQAQWPINQTLFPHQAHKVKQNALNGIRTVTRSLVILGGLSAVFAVVLILCAPLLVNVVLGPAFLPAVPVLRVLAFMVPLQTLCTVISAQWMLPLGFESDCSFVVVTAGILNLTLGGLLSWKLGALGMATAACFAQLYSLLALHVLSRRKGLSPIAGLKYWFSAASRISAYDLERRDVE